MYDMTKLTRKIKFSNVDVVPSSGRAGGLALFWLEDGKMSILDKNRWFYHCMCYTLTKIKPN